MATEIKFCGMTRPEDAREAASLGAAYVGVIFASGPRRLTVERASAVLAELPKSVKRAGVFAESSAAEMAHAAAVLRLEVLQLHGDFGDQVIEELRRSFAGEIWRVLRVAGGQLSDTARHAFAVADAVLLDAQVVGKLGGTGVTLPWRDLSEALTPLRAQARAKFVLAGGLRPENVAEAITLLRPDVVDVSSGVETAPGIKDHARMRAFRDAVHAST